MQREEEAPCEENAFSRDILLEGENMRREATEARTDDRHDAALLSATRAGSHPKTDRTNSSERIGAHVSCSLPVSVS